MAAGSVCIYRKYGHCKYLETCKFRHIEKICDEEACEIENCHSRHPRDCRFFRDYRKCKFGDYCSYNHQNFNAKLDDSVQNELENVKEDLKTMKAKVNELENEVKEKDRHVKEIHESLENLLETRETDAKSIREQILEATEFIVKKSTEAVVVLLDQRQASIENIQSAKLDSLTEQLTALFSLINPGPQQTSSKPSQPTSNLQLKVPNQQHPGRSNQITDRSFTCDLCGQKFEIERTLRNHVRTNHNPPKPT